MTKVFLAGHSQKEGSLRGETSSVTVNSVPEGEFRLATGIKVVRSEGLIRLLVGNFEPPLGRSLKEPL